MINRTTTTTAPIHIGNVIKAHIDKYRLYKSVLARMLSVSDAQIQKYQKAESLQCRILLSISHAMQHNFFADIAAMLPAHYSSNVPTDNTSANRIAALEKENELLQERVKVLMEMRK